MKYVIREQRSFIFRGYLRCEQFNPTMLKNTADQNNALMHWEHTKFFGRVRGSSKTFAVLWVRHPVAVQVHIELTQGQLYQQSGRALWADWSEFQVLFFPVAAKLSLRSDLLA